MAGRGGAVFHSRVISAEVGEQGLVDKVAEGALQGQGIGGKGVGGGNGAGVFAEQRVKSGA